MMTRALVLGGGSLYGIAWESGLLVGLAQAGVDVRGADFIVGTSAGSQVGAVVASGLPWDEILTRQVNPVLPDRSVASVVEAPNQVDMPRQVDIPSVFRLYAQIQAESKTPQEWILGLGALSGSTVTVSESHRRQEIEDRIRMTRWPERLGVVGIEIRSGERVMWTKDSGVDLLAAVAASSALPGVYPASTIGGHQYCDGGIYSMENADLAHGYDKVLILCVGLPIPTPYSLETQIELLRRSGAEVEVLQPDAGVLAVFRQMGGNAVDPRLRAAVAQAAREQSLQLSKKLALFWN